MKPSFRFERWAGLLLLLVMPIGVGMANAAFPSMSLDISSGVPGSTVTANGGNFTPDETVNIYTGSTSGSPAGSSTVRADSLWGPASFRIPYNAVPGSMIITAKGASSTLMVTQPFTVVALSPSIQIGSGTITPGSNLHVTGNGFAPSENVLVTLDIASSTSQADASGNFALDMTVPSITPNTYQVNAVGQSSGAKATGYAYISGFYPTITASSYYAHPGDIVTWSGHGFASNETVTIADATGTVMTSINTDGAGAFSQAGAFAIPFGTGDSITFKITSNISAYDSTSTISLAAFIPQLTPSAFFLQRGNSFTVSGADFAPNESVTVNVRGNDLQTLQADSNGSFSSGAFVVPPSSPSTLGILATGLSSGATASTSVSIGDLVPRTVEPATLALNLIVDNNYGGSGVPEDFYLLVNGANANPSKITFTSSSTSATTTLDGDTDFSITFVPKDPAYSPHWQGSCNGQIIAGATGTCTITAIYSPDISINPASLPGGTVGASYAQTISANTTALGPFTWSIASGTLPDGLNLNTNSTSTSTNLQGQLLKLGNFSFTIEVTNGIISLNRDYTISVTMASTGSGGGGGGGGGVSVNSGSYITVSNSIPNVNLALSNEQKKVLLAELINKLTILRQQIALTDLRGTCKARFTSNLSLGMNGPEVLRLQQILNSSIVTQIAATGPNSPNNETGYFDSATGKAVTAFQEMFGDEILKPVGLQFGTGVVGASTRNKLNSICGGELALKRITPLVAGRFVPGIPNTGKK